MCIGLVYDMKLLTGYTTAVDSPEPKTNKGGL